MADLADNHIRFAKVIGKAWADEDFKRRLLANPKEVLEEEGIVIPLNKEIRIVEDTDDLIHLVIPPKPAEELDLDELGQIVGGTGMLFPPWPLHRSLPR